MPLSVELNSCWFLFKCVLGSLQNYLKVCCFSCVVNRFLLFNRCDRLSLFFRVNAQWIVACCCSWWTDLDECHVRLHHVLNAALKHLENICDQSHQWYDIKCSFYITVHVSLDVLLNTGLKYCPHVFTRQPGMLFATVCFLVIQLVM